MRYAEEMQQIALELEICHGLNVLQCVYNPKNTALSAQDRKRLADAHFRKIYISDAIYVVDIDGYIGESVKEEIAYARAKGKEILYHSRFGGVMPG